MEKIQDHDFRIKKNSDPLGEKELKYLRDKYPLATKDMLIRTDDGYYFTSRASDFDEEFYKNKMDNFSELKQYLSILELILYIEGLNYRGKGKIGSVVLELMNLFDNSTIPLDFDDSIVLRILTNVISSYRFFYEREYDIVQDAVEKFKEKTKGSG
jgi:hypothetical protein